jgi:hypothetical protein
VSDEHKKNSFGKAGNLQQIHDGPGVYLIKFQRDCPSPICLNHTKMVHVVPAGNRSQAQAWALMYCEPTMMGARRFFVSSYRVDPKLLDTEESEIKNSNLVSLDPKKLKLIPGSDCCLDCLGETRVIINPYLDPDIDIIPINSEN